MFRGTLIEDLIATVERVEKHVLAQRESAELERLYLASPTETQRYDQNLVGVS